MAINEDHINDKFSIDQLIRRSWEYKNSDDFIKFINFIASFSHYSYYTKLLVYAQNRAVTFFGGVSYWKKKFDRTINEDARPYVILIPNGPVMMVYDIFDTTGKESPEEFLERGLGSNPLAVAGKVDEGMLTFALSVCKDHGIDVKYKPLSYFHAGSITLANTGKLEICLKEGMSTEQDLSFLLHELAHLFLGHTGHKELTYRNTDRKIKIVGRELSESARELEAETIRYLISFKLGLETRSAEYMADYIKNANDLLTFSYEHVIKTADKMEKIFIL